MNRSLYTGLEGKGTYKRANWQELFDLLQKLYDPLSLRTFKGSANPPVVNRYTQSHWVSVENEKGFGELMILQADNIWSDFQFQFYDKDDTNRFIKVEIDCRNRDLNLSGSLDNRQKLSDALHRIKNTFAIVGNIDLIEKKEHTEKKVFLGSTSKDLRDVRAELIQLIPALGFEIICFEDPNFKKVPGKHTHDMCLDNVPDCDIYVLIIDERFGDEYIGSDPALRGKSVTWAEVEAALKEKKVICTFVRQEVWLEKSTYSWNKGKDINIEPYYAKDKRVFDFIEYIATRSKDNWIDQFKDVVELKNLVKNRLSPMLC